MAIDARAKALLKLGAEFMPGRTMHVQTDEERVAAVDLEASAVHRRHAKPEKGTQEAKEKMAKVRAAKGKKPDPDKGTKLVGMLAKEDGESK